MSYAKRALKGAGYMFVAMVITALLGYAIRIILARSLSVRDYGLFFAVFSFVSFLLFFRDLGLNRAMVKYVAEFKAKRKYRAIKTAISTVFISQIGLSVVFGAVLILFSGFLAEKYFREDTAKILLILYAAYIIFSGLVMWIRTCLQGFQKIRTLSFVEPLRNTLTIAFILLLTAKFGVVGVLIAYIASWVITFSVFTPFVLKAFPIFKYRKIDFWPITKKLYLFAIAVFFTSIGSRIISQFDTLLLTYFRSLEEVGIYQVVLPSASIFLFFSAAISPVLYPIVSELWAKKDKKRLVEGIRLLHKYAFIASIPPILMIFAFSSIFINIFFGADYVPGALAFQILIIGVLIFLVSKINSDVLAGIGKPKEVTKIIGMAAASNIVLNIALIPKYGIEGAAIATAASYLLTMAFSTIRLRKYIKIHVPWVQWAKTFISGAVFLGIVYYVKGLVKMNVWLEVLITVIPAGIIYLLLLHFLGILDVPEIKKYAKLVLK